MKKQHDTEKYDNTYPPSVNREMASARGGFDELSAVQENSPGNQDPDDGDVPPIGPAAREDLAPDVLVAAAAVTKLVVGVAWRDALRAVKIGLWLPADVVRAWCCEPEN